MPFILIGVGLTVPPLHFLSNINIALFGSLIMALLTVGKEVRSKAVHELFEDILPEFGQMSLGDMS
jgi:hypothetical protein